VSFNAKFQAELFSPRDENRRTPTVNHAAAAFIENKRCRQEHRGDADVVNPKAGFVYQTDAN
jgi:hypothetical protein